MTGERCPCGLHDREDVHPDCPIAKDARAAIMIWENNPQRQALARMLGVPPSQISDSDLRRATAGAKAMRNPPMQQMPRRQRSR